MNYIFAQEPDIISIIYTAIPTDQDYGDSNIVYISVGSVVAALIVLTLFITVIILCVLGKRSQKPKKIIISNPISYHKRYSGYLSCIHKFRKHPVFTELF